MPKISKYDDGDFKRMLQILQETIDLNGDIVECGFGKGCSFSVMVEVLSKLGIERDIWEFDSFLGFPIPHKKDAGAERAVRGYRAGWYDINRAKKAVENVCKNHKYPIEKIKIVQGYYQNTLPQDYLGNEIVLLHIDCDLYESYKLAFSLFDKVVSGGIVLFDDLKGRWPGADRAVAEILEETNLELKTIHDRYYIKKV